MDSLGSVTKIEERLVMNATLTNTPINGTFELLPLCNMDCKMCFIRLSPDEMKQQGRLRTVDEWLSLAREARKHGMLFLLLTGGEVFLYPGFQELYQELSKMGFFITINSNGTLITEEIADLLREHMPRRVNITLYGSSADSYEKLCGNAKGFDQTIRGIRLLLERNVQVKLNGSITEYNKEELSALEAIARDLGVPMEADSYMFPCARKGVRGFDYDSRLTVKEAAEAFWQIRKEEKSEEEYWKLVNSLADGYEMTVPVPSKCRPVDKFCSDPDAVSEFAGEEITCRAGKTSFWVTWKGIMTPCVFMEKPSVPVFEIGFEEAWKEISKKRQQLYLPAACTNCSRRKYCTVCGACALTETGDFGKKPHYQCTLTNETMRLAYEIRTASRQAAASSEMSQPSS